MKTFDKNKIHQVPVLIIDYVNQLNNIGNAPEVRENIAQRLEATRDYLNLVLENHYQNRKTTFPKLKSAGLRGTKHSD